jgi:hypothetical protein
VKSFKYSILKLFYRLCAQQSLFYQGPLLAGAFFLTSCALYAPGTTKAVSKVCLIPSDQSGTISGKWPATPVPIAFHNGDFSSAELLSMTGAVDNWNTFFATSKGFNTLTYGGNSSAPTLSNNSDNATSSSFCATGVIQGTPFTGNVVIFKKDPWPAAYTASAIGLTSFCTYSATPYRKIYTAVIELNYTNFFASGKKQPDMGSVLLHEFGHLLGLNHSCESTSKTGTPNCTDPSLVADYREAVMFPAFTFSATGAGEVKQTLQKNDQERANCLY